MKENDNISLMIGSSDRVKSDCVTKFNRQMTSHPTVTETRRITKFSTRQTRYIRKIKPTQNSNLNNQQLGHSMGKFEFIISVIESI